MAADSPSPDGVILGLLAGEAQSGYTLLAYFRDHAALGLVWQMSASQVYAVLKRLERQGYIRSEPMPTSAGPERINHALTATGKAALMEWLNATPGGTVRRVRVEFLSRVFIARRLQVAVVPIRERQLAACQEVRISLVLEKDSLPAESTGGVSPPILIIAELDVAIQWLTTFE